MVTAPLSLSRTQQLAERVGSVMAMETLVALMKESHVLETGLADATQDSAAAAVHIMAEEAEGIVAALGVCGVTVYVVEEAVEAIVERRPTARKKAEETIARTVESSSQDLLVIAAETE